MGESKSGIISQPAMKLQSLGLFPTACADTEEVIPVHQSLIQIFHHFATSLHFTTCWKPFPKNSTVQIAGWLEKMTSFVLRKHLTAENSNLALKMEVLAGQRMCVLSWTKYLWEDIYILIPFASLNVVIERGLFVRFLFYFTGFHRYAELSYLVYWWLGSAGLMAELKDLRDLSQPK